MKPLHIDFVRNRNSRIVWACTVACGILIAAGTAWQWHRLDTLAQAEAATSKQVSGQIAQLASNAPVVDPLHANARQTAQVLQRDLNKVFSAVENLQEPGVRLRNLSLDASAGLLRLEYELDSIPRASSVTAVLNSGYEGRPWQLEGITSASGGQATSAPSATTGFRATWSTRLDKL